MNLTDGDCLIGEVEVVVAGPSCDRSRQVTDVCSGTESSVSPNNDMSEIKMEIKKKNATEILIER